ncbi:MAG: phage portal protein [Eubacterium sp.]|nr:phage portal protein [Eubacterium sp.]
MEFSFHSRLKHAWNAFFNKDPTGFYKNVGMGYSYRPDRIRFSRGNERSIVTSVYNRIALDAAAVDLFHVRLDENNRFLSTIDSGLHNCLTVSANMDQTGRAFLQDVVMSMLDEGCVAIVPVDTTDNPEETGAYDIETMRTGKILEWYPQHVKVLVYNERTGKKEDVLTEKNMVAIVENPLYAVMNEPNSTMQRLIRKLNLLDAIDEQNGSGKLDLIIQLPYVIKTEARRAQAENRRKDIESQLAGSKYGIAYTDGTEHITQLNRPVENNLMSQIEYLTSMLYGQLGITQGILDGTADEKTMLNYYNRTIEPILSAIADEMKRKFLTKTARSQFQSIEFFRDPFRLVPVADISEIADKFTRNEIMTSNEIRQVIGMKPSDDPKADELRNKNLSESAGKPIDKLEEKTIEEDVEHLAHHGVEGQKWGVRNGPPYPLDRSGGKEVAKSGKGDKIKSSVIQNAIASGKVLDKINQDKQRKHTKSGRIKGRSYLEGDEEYAEKLYKELRGTGEALIDWKTGEWLHKEKVSASHIIGTHIGLDGIETKTNAAMISYSKTGAHIYPRKEKTNET